MDIELLKASFIFTAAAAFLIINSSLPDKLQSGLKRLFVAKSDRNRGD